MSVTIQVIKDKDISKFPFSDSSSLVYISYPDEEIDDNKFKRYEEEYQILFLEFTDNVPNPSINFIEEGSCDLQMITDCLDLLDDPELKRIYICSTKNSSRAASIALGLSVAVGFETGKKIIDILYDFVSSNPDVQPNRWVVGLFDYVLELEGKLVMALDDYCVTGLVVNSLGRTVNGTWSV